MRRAAAVVSVAGMPVYLECRLCKVDAHWTINYSVFTQKVLGIGPTRSTFIADQIDYLVGDANCLIVRDHGFGNTGIANSLQNSTSSLEGEGDSLAAAGSMVISAADMASPRVDDRFDATLAFMLAPSVTLISVARTAMKPPSLR
jgi:hypothetical protein